MSKKIKENKVNIFDLATGMQIDHIRVHTILKREKLPDTYKTTPERLQKLVKKYYGGE
jgi:hypothetical protein